MLIPKYLEKVKWKLFVANERYARTNPPKNVYSKTHDNLIRALKISNSTFFEPQFFYSIKIHTETNF